MLQNQLREMEQENLRNQREREKKRLEMEEELKRKQEEMEMKAKEKQERNDQIFNQILTIATKLMTKALVAI